MATVPVYPVSTGVTRHTSMHRLVEPNPSRGWTIWRPQEPVYKLPMCQCFQMAKPTTLAHFGHVIWLSEPTDSKTALCLDTSDLGWAILGAGDTFRSFQCVAAFKQPIQRHRHSTHVVWLIRPSNSKTALGRLARLQPRQKAKAGVMPQPERVS